MNLAFFASHRGSNMQAVIDACKAGDLPQAVPCVVMSNNSKAEALLRAAQEGIPHYHLSSKHYPQPEALDRAILQTLQRHATELVILAGYLRKLGPQTLTAYAGRVINIHPALLPRYGGQGMYGTHIHEAVLAAGEVETGITIHLVDEEYDHGAILAQRRIPVLADDTVTTLAKRVLDHEHTFLVETIAAILGGEIKLPTIIHP
ncbi:MAG: phosphoribosylglycinamide formyltransferase [Caldilineaceae bacterium]|nr:phosphoribosylglycinamide formyltransferase [Caldilineaceae bacterium]